ncbi:MAG: transcriptional regulator containing AAA-type ATPase, and DNA-binding domain [Peptococcaceae bacterium]|jgi:arginine utilization regulatory protein|nr:transcriptional regulator containing AAA-type ATPase, and DNA-binding domain [Peptococcaceae bacterium]
MNVSSFKQNNEIFHTILGALREGVNVVDKDGIILYANQSSANYAKAHIEEMIGKHITVYYPKAALLEVLETRNAVFDRKIIHETSRIFIVNAIPLYIQGEFAGGVATFRDITEIERLSKRLESLEMELALSRMNDVFEAIIGSDGSLKSAIDKAQRSIASLGGPRHSVIVGETGTGKTMLAKAMYSFAERLGVIKQGAPFVEINCAQFTNSDIAAMEVFGTEKGSFTGAYDKPGLIEIANGGILFLDEAQALGAHQTMLLKVIESGMVRRIGGRSEREVNVIIITASSKDLKKEFIPELYQRLAQYQIELPPLRKRSVIEKDRLMNYFIALYQMAAKNRYNITLEITFTDKAREILLNAAYERNIRQFRDVINASIDSAAPLISSVEKDKQELRIIVDESNLPFGMFTDSTDKDLIVSEPAESLEGLIQKLHEEGLGPRKISNELKRRGIKLEYYQIAYRLKNYKLNSFTLRANKE